MSRILLADDSPHAQRMGERILREEGYEVVSVTDGETALLRLADVDPDVIVADVFLPGRSGLEMCRQIKADPKHRHVRIVLTAGLLEIFNEAEAAAAGADAIIKKPFEASVVVQTIKPLCEQARAARQAAAEPVPEAAEPAPAAAPAGETFAAGALSEQERIRAAVVLALDSAFPALVDRITEQVLTARNPKPAIEN